MTKLEEEIDVYNGYDKVEREKKALERCLHEYRMAVNQAQINKLSAEKAKIVADRE